MCDRLIKINGHSIYRAFYSIINEYGERLYQAFVPSTSIEAVAQGVKDLIETKTALFPDEAPIEYLTSDQCCKDRAGYQALIPGLQRGLRVPPPIDLAKNSCVFVKSSDECTSRIHQMMNALDQLGNNPSECMVGLCIFPKMKSINRNLNIKFISIAMNSSFVCTFDLSKVNRDGIHPDLKAFLTRSTIKKIIPFKAKVQERLYNVLGLNVASLISLGDVVEGLDETLSPQDLFKKYLDKTLPVAEDLQSLDKLAMNSYALASLMVAKSPQIREESTWMPKTRVLLDPFHFINRGNLSSKHRHFALFKRLFADALLHAVPDDKAIIEQRIECTGLNFEQAMSNPRWRKKICKYMRRQIPSPDLILPTLRELFLKFHQDPSLFDCGAPLLNTRNYAVLTDNLVHVEKECLSDPFNSNLYYIKGVCQKGIFQGLPRYGCIRGTNELEGGVHSKLMSSLTGTTVSFRLMSNHIQELQFRQNIVLNCKNRQGRPFPGHFNLTLLGHINFYSSKLYGRPSYPDVAPLIGRQIGPLATGFPQIGFSSPKLASRLRMAPSLTWLAEKQGSEVPFTPICSFTEQVMYEKAYPLVKTSQGIDFIDMANRWNNGSFLPLVRDGTFGKNIFFKTPAELKLYEKRGLEHMSKQIQQSMVHESLASVRSGINETATMIGNRPLLTPVIQINSSPCSFSNCPLVGTGRLIAGQSYCSGHANIAAECIQFLTEENVDVSNVELGLVVKNLIRVAQHQLLVENNVPIESMPGQQRVSLDGNGRPKKSTHKARTCSNCSSDICPKRAGNTRKRCGDHLDDSLNRCKFLCERGTIDCRGGFVIACLTNGRKFPKTDVAQQPRSSENLTTLSALDSSPSTTNHETEPSSSLSRPNIQTYQDLNEYMHGKYGYNGVIATVSGIDQDVILVEQFICKFPDEAVLASIWLDKLRAAKPDDNQ